MRTVLLPLLVVPLLLLPAPARADGDAVAQAKQRFTLGAQAYREARYKDAIELFIEANRLDPHADLIFNVGQAYEKSGDVPNALRSYREYLRLLPAASDRATVEASIKNLETRLRERGVQQVSIFSTPSGATLVLDQKPVGQTPWTGEIAPGRHLAVLKASGYPDNAKEFQLASDRAMDLDIALTTVGSGVTTLAPVAGEKPGAPPDVPKKRSVAPWTITALGLGVAGLGGALGFELARKSAESDAKGDPTQVGFKSAYDSMTSRQLAARVLVGVGAAATALGGVLLVLDLRGGSAPQKASVGCVDGACGAFVSGRF
jgi:tetratricopeptide (TPR) repeat protein